MKGKTTKTKSTSTPIIPEGAKGQIDNYYTGLGSTFQNGSPQDFVVQPTAQQQAAFGTTFTGQNDTINEAVRQAGKINNAGYTLAQNTQGTAQQAQAPDRGILGGLTLNDPTKVDLSGLQGLQATQAQQGQQAVAGTAGGSMASQFVDQYQPYANKALVDNTMASFRDQSGREKAAYAAEAAGRGAFGGSRQAIGEAQLGADISLRGGLLRSQMEDAALTRALGAAAGDADRTTQAGIATAGNQTQASVANANNDSTRMQFNALQQNNLLNLLTKGQIDAAMTDANIARDYGIEAFQQGNENNRTVYSTLADLAQSNATEANNMAGLNVQEANKGAQFNAQTATDNSEFNRSLALDRAGLLGELGVAQGQYARDDATLNANLGQMDRNQQLQNQLAPYAYQQMYGELLNPALINAISGTQTTGTQKESGGFGSSLLGGLFGLGAGALSGGYI